jgi:Holliday junction resolvase RusA-like endonuclease
MYYICKKYKTPAKKKEEKVKIIIPGDPIPLARPRLGKNGVYDPQAELKEETYWEIRSLLGNRHLPLMGPLELQIVFYMKIPKKNKDIYHIKKPDLSNMIKFYEDAATGLLYKDDKQIVKITAEKKYDETPRTEITIMEIK